MASPTVDRRFGLVGNAAIKAPVLVVATTNITLFGEQTIDGVAVHARNASNVADRVLLTAQNDATENGIWDVSTSSWGRSKDADGRHDFVKGTTVFVTDGTANHGTYWQITSDGPIVIGDTEITWTTVITAVSSAVAQAQAAAAAAEDSADAAATSATNAATNEDNAAASEAAAAASAAAALLSEGGAATASATAGAYPNTAASNVPRGLTQASVGAITPGAGGTNGTFALGWSGGNFSINPTGTFTVAGGALTAVTITGPGLYIGAAPTVPTPSFAASAGLAGAAVALTAQFLVTSGQGYWVQSADLSTLDRYINVSGVATADTSITSLDTILFDADAFPGTRNLYGPILTPRCTDLAGSNFSVDFPADHKFTVTAGTANDYTAAINGLTPLQPFILYIKITAGTLGVVTFTMNGAKSPTKLRRGLWVYEGTVPAATTTASIVIKNGSAGAVMEGYCHFAVGPVGATGVTPVANSTAVDSFFDSGMPFSDLEMLRPTDPVFMAVDATSALTTVTSLMSNVVLGDTIVVLAHATDLGGADAMINDVSYRVTATSEVIYSLYPLAEHPGWWYREIYLDPTAYTGGTITLVRLNANNKSNSNLYTENARYVTHYVWRDALPKFYASAAPDEGRGIQHAGNMRTGRAYSTTAAAEYTGYLAPLFGGVRRLWIYSSAGGDYSIVRKDVVTGDFIGSVLNVTHAGGGWKAFTNSIPYAWRQQADGFVVGIAPNAGGSPGLVHYGTTVVSDPAPTNSSWKSGTTNGDDLTLFAGVGERLPGIYVEVEDRPGAVKRMGPTILTRTGAADYQLDWILGQSGYEGYAMTVANNPDYSKITPAASWMWHRGQSAWVPLHDPVGQNNPVGGSPWPAYAKEYEERMKSRAILAVNSAYGGTSIQTDWWDDVTGAKPKWTAALADLDAAMDAAWAANMPISGMAVHIDLGEGNGLSGTSAAAFKTDLLSWIVQIRAATGNPCTPIFYRPPGRGGAGDVANFAQINKAINEVAAVDSYFFVTSGEAVTDDRGLKDDDNYHDVLFAQEETGRLLAALTPVPAARAMPANYTLDVAR